MLYTLICQTVIRLSPSKQTRFSVSAAHCFIQRMFRCHSNSYTNGKEEKLANTNEPYSGWIQSSVSLANHILKSARPALKHVCCFAFGIFDLFCLFCWLKVCKTKAAATATTTTASKRKKGTLDLNCKLNN